MPPGQTDDVIVVGAGPAGWALATACAGVGLATRLVDPAPQAEWVPNYGAFVDELASVGFAACFSKVWPATRITCDAERSRRIERAYGRVDGVALRARLAAEFSRAGGRVTVACARRAVVAAESEATLECEGHPPRRARLIFDATGHRPALVGPSPPALGFQTALGRTLLGAEHPFPPDEMRLMDFSPVAGDELDGPRPPTFLYAMPLGGGRVFAEETVLSSRTAPDFADLDARLQARLGGLGVRWSGSAEEERCWIPMGGRPPAPHPAALPFGAAAGLVHPATGYQLATALRLAPQVAAALRDALPGGASVARQAAEWAIWPAERRRLWTVLRFGLTTLLPMSRRDLADFFWAFFDLPEPLWSAYLAGTATPEQAARAMRGVFARLPNRLRAGLIARSLSPGGFRALGALTGGATAHKPW